MSEPYVGEIRLFAGNFAPAGWWLCDGTLLPISEYDNLFNLIGTTYGGDGQETFALPNMQSRVPLHVGTLAGNTYMLGQNSGEESVQLSVNQIPTHTHIPQASSTTGTSPTPLNSVYAASTLTMYSSGAPGASLDGGAVGSSGGSQPHDNMIPFLAVNFIISLLGVYPSQS